MHWRTLLVGVPDMVRFEGPRLPVRLWARGTAAAGAKTVGNGTIKGKAVYSPARHLLAARTATSDGVPKSRCGEFAQNRITVCPTPRRAKGSPCYFPLEGPESDEPASQPTNHGEQGRTRAAATLRTNRAAMAASGTSEYALSLAVVTEWPVGVCPHRRRRSPPHACI